MAFDFGDLKNKVSKGIKDVSENETFKKVVDSTKDVADKVVDKAKDVDMDKVKDKSQDVFDGTKKTFRRASQEINEKLDKLKKQMNNNLLAITFILFMSIVDMFMAIKALKDNRTRHGIFLLILGLVFMIGTIILIATNQKKNKSCDRTRSLIEQQVKICLSVNMDRLFFCKIKLHMSDNFKITVVYLKQIIISLFWSYFYCNIWGNKHRFCRA